MATGERERMLALLDLLASRPLFTRKDLARRYGCDVLTITRRYRRGDLPKPLFLQGCYPVWCPATIEAWDRTLERQRKRKRAMRLVKRAKAEAVRRASRREKSKNL